MFTCWVGGVKLTCTGPGQQTWVLQQPQSRLLNVLSPQLWGCQLWGEGREQQAAAGCFAHPELEWGVECSPLASLPPPPDVLRGSSSGLWGERGLHSTSFPIPLAPARPLESSSSTELSAVVPGLSGIHLLPDLIRVIFCMISHFKNALRMCYNIAIEHFQGPGRMKNVTFICARERTQVPMALCFRNP